MNKELTMNVLLSPLALELRNLRVQKCLNYKDVALACHISVADVLAYETDKKIPSESTKSQLLEFLTT